MIFLNLLAKSLFFDKFVVIFGKKYGPFSQKNLRRIFLSEFVYGYFKTKKKFLFPLSSRGGGKALVAGPLKKRTFFAVFLRNSIK